MRWTGCYRSSANQLTTRISGPVATKNIVHFDSVDFIAEVVVRSRHENYRPSPPVHPARTIPEPRPPAPRNSSAPPTAGDGEPSTTQATPFSLVSTCSGSGSTACGSVACKHCGSSNRIPWCAGTAKAFDFIGPENPVATEAGVHVFHLYSG